MHLSFYFLKLILKRKINQLSKNEACNGNIRKLFCFRESYLKCSTDHKEILDPSFNNLNNYPPDLTPFGLHIISVSNRPQQKYVFFCLIGYNIVDRDIL